ncbi:hypothetical protein [Oceaniserpentilla sp. 4NH20-0058]|uniref:hypothetical protein n=1 Tax=Oceaniserpentilla sp. 4NH20-0058 TaxID=3127660 RepID=UPI0033400269
MSFIIILVYGLIIAMFVYSHKWAFKTSPQNLTWEQPSLVNNKELISSDNYRIRFNSVEKAYNNIKLKDDGSLVLDTNTAHALESAFSHIPIDATPRELERFTMLINRMHPYVNNQQLSELTLNYRDYVAAKYEFNKKQKQEKSSIKVTQALQYEFDLQKKYFGEQAAKDMFGDRPKMASYNIESGKVLTD